MRPTDPDVVVLSVGRRIAEIREQQGRTQEEMAGALGLAPRNYQRLERGANLTIRTLVTVANELGVRPIELWTPAASGKRPPGRPRKVR